MKLRMILPAFAIATALTASIPAFAQEPSSLLGESQAPSASQLAAQATDIANLSLSLDSEAGPLAIGDLDQGYWSGDASSSAYFKFYASSILERLSAVATYGDGTISEIQLDESQLSFDCSTWSANGRNNTVTVAYEGLSAKVGMNVKRLADAYASSPSLQLDTAQQITYSAARACSAGAFFTPSESGTYYFYSKGSYDTYARLYGDDGYGVRGADANDDGLDGANFLITAKLEADTTYILATKANTASASYEVVVTSTPIPDGYASVASTTLTGKTIELALVVDTTGSMTSIIEGLRDNLRTFSEALHGTGATVRISLIDYRDVTEDANSTVVHRTSANPPWYEYAELDGLIDEIKTLRASGGGDIPESAIDALANLVTTSTKAAEITFDNNAAKFALLITDAPFKTNDDNTHGIEDMNDLATRLKNAGITTSVVTVKNYYEAYRDTLASTTGGKLFNAGDGMPSAMAAFAAEVAAKADAFTPSPTEPDTPVGPVGPVGPDDPTPPTPGDDPNDEDRIYRVSVDHAISHGSVSTDHEKAAPGKRVTVTAKPDEGYVLDKIVVAGSDGTLVEISENSFEMPTFDVTVSAIFAQLPDTPTDPDEPDNPNDPTEPSASDRAAAQNVINLIDSIGKVTVSSEKAIKEAEKAYANLTSAQKELVTNYPTLTTARSVYDAAVKASENAVVTSGSTTMTAKVLASGTVTIKKVKKTGKAITINTVRASNGKTYKVTAIAANAFKGTSATKVTIGNNVKTVGAAAFANAKKLKRITIGNKVTKLGKGVLKGCSNLSTVIVGSKVKTVGASAFQNDKKLKTLKVKSAKLTKSSCKKMLNDSQVKSVKLTGMTKVQKKNVLKTYKKWFPKKVAGKKLIVK